MKGVTDEKDNTEMVCKHCADERKMKFQMSGKQVRIGDFVKVGIKDSEEVEHMWCHVKGVRGDGKQKIYIAEVANDPVAIKNVKLGDRIEFDYGQIEDLLRKGEVT